ncbi:MAG: ATP-binding protein [Selenomonadaceae bacterium]|nr:ATP-binding protein [Selenomonadaceae bacterium]
MIAMDLIELNELLVLKNLINDDVLQALAQDDSTTAIRLLVERAERFGMRGNLIRCWLLHLLTREPNLVSTTMERSRGKLGDSLRKLFVNDIEKIMPLLNESSHKRMIIYNYKPTVERKSATQSELVSMLNRAATSKQVSDALIEYYRRFGYGDMAEYRAFKWSGGKLVGIEHFDAQQFEDLIGYEHQKEQLIENTEAFLDGKGANNVLLVGARGTGKSSSVKALVNRYYDRSLRLIQLTKPQLIELASVMDELRQYASRKFIVFLDDLSFEEDESEYKYLKSAIEGGVETRPSNVLIYATSNRRHLIRESWRDRRDDQEELYKDDSANETISLSDRFGLIIHYYAPTQDEYLAIIKHMLGKNGISLEGEALRIEGLRWEMTHSGRNGRTAQQFVTHYLGRK